MLEGGLVEIEEALVVLFTDEEAFLAAEEGGEEDSLFVGDNVEDGLVEDRSVEDEDLPELETLTEEGETFGDVREVCKEDLEALDEVCRLLRDDEVEEAATSRTPFPCSKSKSSMEIKYSTPTRNKRNKRTIFIAMLFNFRRHRRNK